jgi:hypothetical protein
MKRPHNFEVAASWRGLYQRGIADLMLRFAVA